MTGPEFYTDEQPRSRSRTHSTRIGYFGGGSLQLLVLSVMLIVGLDLSWWWIVPTIISGTRLEFQS